MGGGGGGAIHYIHHLRNSDTGAPYYKLIKTKN